MKDARDRVLRRLLDRNRVISEARPLGGGGHISATALAVISPIAERPMFLSASGYPLRRNIPGKEKGRIG
jgi:nanoRNase/pAp phosphatase (c-di-AMP/oligoRNAs hydrolase)